MNTSQLRNFLARSINPTKCLFLGVFSRVTIPSSSAITHYHCCFISNNELSPSKGRHWVVFFLPSSTHIDFFDSFGRHYRYYGFDKLFQLYPQLISVSSSSIRLQSSNSTVCGCYCLYFILQRSFGLAFDQIISSFSAHTYDWYDSHVSKFVDEHSR